MKKITLFFLVLLFSFTTLFSQQKEIIINCTGYGFDANTTNGIAGDMYTYLQKFATLNYNGQDARPTAIRFYVDWGNYEPTLGNYQGAKLITAMQTLQTLMPGAKIALHFPFQRHGYQPDQAREGYFGDEDLARISNGSIVHTQISWTCPSV